MEFLLQHRRRKNPPSFSFSLSCKKTSSGKRKSKVFHLVSMYFGEPIRRMQANVTFNVSNTATRLNEIQWLRCYGWGSIFLYKFVLLMFLVLLLRRLPLLLLLLQLSMWEYIEFDVVYIKCKPTATLQ